MTFQLSAAARLLSLATLLAIVGCGSDSGDDDSGGDDAPCVKVHHYKQDGSKDREEACATYPASCADEEDGCGAPGSECDKGLDALCTDGAERNTCVAASLNDRVTSVEITCQFPKQTD